MEIKILAGPSGAGKSSYINKVVLPEISGRCLRLEPPHFWLTDDFTEKDVVILSADDITFDAEGFHVDRLSGAHATCIRTFMRILQMEEKNWPGVIVIDNTNTSPWEIAPYVALAESMVKALCGLPHVDVELEVLVFERDWKECSDRNAHGTPALAIRKQARRLATMLDEWPPYWPPLNLL